MDEQREIRVDVDEIHNGPSGEVCRQPRGWRRLAEPALLVAVGVGAVLAAQHLGGPTGAPTGASTGGAAVPSDQAVVHPDLIAYSTGRAGEPVTLVAHRRDNVCAPTVLMLDDVPIQQRHVRYFDALHPDWVGLLVTFDLPATTPPGAHEIALVGPAPGCGETTRLAAVTITVSR